MEAKTTVEPTEEGRLKSATGIATKIAGTSDARQDTDIQISSREAAPVPGWEAAAPQYCPPTVQRRQAESVSGLAEQPVKITEPKRRLFFAGKIPSKKNANASDAQVAADSGGKKTQEQDEISDSTPDAAVDSVKAQSFEGSYILHEHEFQKEET